MIVVNTKPVGHESSRWISVAVGTLGIDIVLNYTDSRNGCYLRRYLAQIRTIGL